MGSSISDLAASFGISTRTLRFYEQKGLLAPTRIDGVRLYSPSDRVRIELILTGKRLGFSIDEIAELILAKKVEISTDFALSLLVNQLEDQLALLEKRKMEVDTAIAELEQMQSDLAKKY